MSPATPKRGLYGDIKVFTGSATPGHDLGIGIGFQVVADVLEPAGGLLQPFAEVVDRADRLLLGVRGAGAESDAGDQREQERAHQARSLRDG